ncbi:threonine synthase [Endozoicomonas sp. Mp262]|uniref:threonine synthase n=1 Tax=Endozoicomonas sp. Mp262 TaxID=2919499 RepID=UPI0021D8DE38
MRYISTRGTDSADYSFMEVLLKGMPEDGGLYVPKELPRFSPEKISSLKGLAYNDIAFEIIKPFTGDCIPDEVLKEIIGNSYGTFDHSCVAPLYPLYSNVWVLELFHGPTLAFKDFALQILGRLLDYALEQEGRRAIVLGATSGDTGSAAIEGCRHSKNLDIIILHPHKRVSEIQRRQMTTVLASNVHNFAIDGNFDDCQELVKQCLIDQSFLPKNINLVAVNSINWARIMAQIVYYFYASVQLGGSEREIVFSVPTGNFGDIYAGYIAKRMGLPISKLVVATNKNDILHRFFQNNDYSRKTLYQTLSPSMDIMVSSNFERLLFDAYQQDASAIKELMSQFHDSNKLTIKKSIWLEIKQYFSSYSAQDSDICDTMKKTYNETSYLLDPHTATGIHALKSMDSLPLTPQVSLATAHPIKFQQAIVDAQLTAPKPPQSMRELLTKQEKYNIIPKNLDNLKKIIITLT